MDDLWSLFYVMPGSYGAFFGIIAGPLGVCASNSKKINRMKCQWIAHIVLVRMRRLNSGIFRIFELSEWN